MKLAGRHALITGANRGFGLAVARAFAAEGAHVTICARDDVKLGTAREKVAAVANGGARVMAVPVNVVDPDAMAQTVASSEYAHGPLDILVANAGVYGPKGRVHEVAWDAWTDAVAINLFGAVLSCRAALPSLLREGREYRGKIILLSGGGATKPLPRLSAYAASKAAVVRFGETLAEEVRNHGIDVNAVAPGALNTRLLEEVLEAGPERVGDAFYEQALRQKAEGGTPLSRGAELCVFLASDASDGITGRLISAVWDPWERLDEFADPLDASDIYTLRRIVPEDRGQVWQ